MGIIIPLFCFLVPSLKPAVNLFPESLIAGLLDETYLFISKINLVSGFNPCSSLVATIIKNEYGIVSQPAANLGCSQLFSDTARPRKWNMGYK